MRNTESRRLLLERRPFRTASKNRNAPALLHEAGPVKRIEQKIEALLCRKPADRENEWPTSRNGLRVLFSRKFFGIAHGVRDHHQTPDPGAAPEPFGAFLGLDGDRPGPRIGQAPRVFPRASDDIVGRMNTFGDDHGNPGAEQAKQGPYVDQLQETYDDIRLERAKLAPHGRDTNKKIPDRL